MELKIRKRDLTYCDELPEVFKILKGDIDIKDWAESICRVVCRVLWWSLVKDIEIILFCEKEKSHPESL